MTRTTPVVLVAVLLVAAAVAPLGAASAIGTAGSQADFGTDAESIAPGERLAGVVGVQNAEVQGDVSERAFSARVANASDDDAKAAVVEDEFAESEARIAELEDRLVELNESREAGELAEGRYRAEVATAVAEIRAIERRAEAMETAADGLPASTLDDRGVDVDSIQTLRNRASDLGGPETAEIARSIAGDDVGGPVGPDREPGRPVGVGNDRDGGTGTDGATGGPGTNSDRGSTTASGSDDPAETSPNADPGAGQEAEAGQADSDTDTDSGAGRASDASPGDGPQNESVAG